MEWISWLRRRFISPAPNSVKRQVLLRYGGPDSVWIESGTLTGGTTAFLSRHASFVHSIEVDPGLAKRAVDRFKGNVKVRIHQGDSGQLLPEILNGLSSGNVNFWLDGHYSGVGTGKGAADTPIIAELRAIEDSLKRSNGRLKYVVCVDDVRCFDPAKPEYAGYPPLDYLVDWARNNRAKWNIEHDIFVATIVRS
jgi:hypothetical protein